MTSLFFAFSNTDSGSQIIYSTVRSITPDDLEWYLKDCIALKKEFPHLIAGVFLVPLFIF